ncbi:MAG TPA: helix-hairpin-helix domain-containing protein [Caldilineaceae bacterium]|nr:helix-hairpin-helix domain-containing protein [Caldilineaceae bacterium]
MLFWLGLVAGAIIGWVVEWIIDWRFWRKDLTVTTDEESRLRKELEVARLEINNLQNRLRTQETTNPDADRLQDIDGIGPVYARKLQDAGIHTYAQLATTSIERLTEIINPQEWQTIKFDDWIRQARVLGESTAQDRGGK